MEYVNIFLLNKAFNYKKRLTISIIRSNNSNIVHLHGYMKVVRNKKNTGAVGTCEVHVETQENSDISERMAALFTN